MKIWQTNNCSRCVRLIRQQFWSFLVIGGTFYSTTHRIFKNNPLKLAAVTTAAVEYMNSMSQWLNVWEREILNKNKVGSFWKSPSIESIEIIFIFMAFRNMIMAASVCAPNIRFGAIDFFFFSNIFYAFFFVFVFISRLSVYKYVRLLFLLLLVAGVWRFNFRKLF